MTVMKPAIFSADRALKRIDGTASQAPTRFAVVPRNRTNLEALPAFESDSTNVTVVIESPHLSAVRFNYNAAFDVFESSCILPAGSQFPLDFGFVPSTQAEDGHPLDIVVFTDSPACVGCVLAARPIGVIEAEQTRDGQSFRSDRLIGVATTSRKFAHLESIDDLNPRILDEIERFLVSYHRMHRRLFRPLRRAGSAAAIELVCKSMGEAAPAYVPEIVY
jgi:inorganic pyrophosphatase